MFEMQKAIIQALAAYVKTNLGYYVDIWVQYMKLDIVWVTIQRVLTLWFVINNGIVRYCILEFNDGQAADKCFLTFGQTHNAGLTRRLGRCSHHVRK